MTEKNILDKLKAECNACAPDNFSEIENQIKSTRHRRLNIILKISAAAAVIAVPFLSVIVSQKFKPIEPEDIKLAEITIDTTDYTPETDDTAEVTNPVSEKGTQKSTVTASPVESGPVPNTENTVKTESYPDSHSNQTGKVTSKHVSSADVIPETTNRTDPYVSDKPQTNSTYKPSHTTKPVVSSSKHHTTSRTDPPHDEEVTTKSEIPVTQPPEYETTAPSHKVTTQQCTTSAKVTVASKQTECTSKTPIQTPPKVTSACTTKPTSAERPLSINFVLIAAPDDPLNNPLTKIYEGQNNYYLINGYNLYTVELNYSDYSQTYSIDEVLTNTGLTIDDLVQAGLTATNIEK